MFLPLRNSHIAINHRITEQSMLEGTSGDVTIDDGDHLVQLSG